MTGTASPCCSPRAYAGSTRPAAWIDDDLDDRCEAWVARRDAPTLLVRTDPALGLADEHVTELERWAAHVSGRYAV